MVPIEFLRSSQNDQNVRSTDHGQFGYGDEAPPPNVSTTNAGRASSPTDFIARRRPANNESDRGASKRLRPTLTLRGNTSGNYNNSTTDSATGPPISSPDSFSSFSSGHTPTPVFRNILNPYDTPFSGESEPPWDQFQDGPHHLSYPQNSPPTPPSFIYSPSAQVSVSHATPSPTDVTNCASGFGHEACTVYTCHYPRELATTRAPCSADGSLLENGSSPAPQTGAYHGPVFTNQLSAFHRTEAQAQNWCPQSQRTNGHNSAIVHAPMELEHHQRRLSGSLAARSNHASQYSGATVAIIERKADPRPSPNPVPATSFQNILHPVDQTPTLKHSTLPPTVSISRTVLLPKLPGVNYEGSGGMTDQTHGSLKTRRPRSAFPPDLRDETNLTRAIGACLRCRSQRVRCVSSAKGPNYPCKTCESVAQSSKKVIHDFCCVRFKFGGPSAYRVGGLQLTTRWKGVEVCDVPPEADSPVKEIDVKIYYSSLMHRYDLCDTPARLRVCRFTPKPGDVLSRKWTTHTVDEEKVVTVKKRHVELPPYALEDIRRTGDEMAVYFEENVVQAMVNTATHSIRVIRDHMLLAVKHYQSLPDDSVEKDFLHNFFLLWFYNRFTMGSAYIFSENKLGCAPVTDPSYPLGDRISLPRMITAQFDSIMATRFIQPMAKKVHTKFERFFLSGNPEYWFTLYICTFIMLAEVSFSCQDRRRHAIENWTSKRYTVPKAVINIQFGGMTALYHWLYYRTVDPSEENWNLFCEVVNHRTLHRPKVPFSRGKRNKKAYLTDDQFAMVNRYWQEMADFGVMMSKVPYSTAYEHPLFFVSQMYPKGRKVLGNYRVPRVAFENGTVAVREEATGEDLNNCFLQGISDDDVEDEDVCSHNVAVTNVCFRCLRQSP